METGLGATRGRRVKFGGVAAPSVRGTTATTTSTTPSAFPTAQPTTHQKVRRILEEHAEWQERSQKPLKTSSSSPCVVSNYSIVASRGELSRNSFSVCETPAPNKKKLPEANGKVSKEDNLRSILFGRKPLKAIKDSKDTTQTKLVKNGQATINKSASLTTDSKEDPSTKEKQFHKLQEDGLLKRSSTFLASLTNSNNKNTPENRNYFNIHNFSFQKLTKGTVFNGRSSDLDRLPSPVFRRSSPSLTNGHSSISACNGKLKRSPSFQTLPTSWKKPSRATVKKSVSFSLDTSFEVKRSPYKKTAVHDAKVYRQGVLQEGGDSSKEVQQVKGKSSLGGPKALLRAAREADEVTLKNILSLAQNLGLGDMDINVVDSSGRTALSYMAGNGAIAMLEAALSFPDVDPNLPDNEGNTPLHFAAQAGQTECVNALLQRCPNIEVDARNILGFTPLMKAALQGRTKCAKILLFAGANPTLRDHGRGLRAEQWARFCGRYVCAEVIERFARHRLLARTTSCRWGSEPELAAKVFQGKVTPIPTNLPPPSTGLRSKIRRVFRTSSGPDRSFSLVSQLTSAALCASSPALPKPGDVPPVVKSLLRPLSVPQLRITLVAPPEIIDCRPAEKYGTNFTEKIVSEKIESAIVKPPRTKKKNK